MSLQRFNSSGSAMTPTSSSSSSSPSLRHKSSTRIPRLSNNMVSLRYEDAVQAQPPIMVASAKRTKSNSSASSAASSSASSISNLSTESAASVSTRSSTDSNHYTSRIGRSRSSRSFAPSYSAFPSPPSPSEGSSRLSSATTVTSVSTCSDSPLPSPISISAARGSRIPRSPTLGSSMPASPAASVSPASPTSPTSPTSATSPTTPTSPRYPLVFPRPTGLAAPPVEQHPALRGSASPAFRPIVEETSETSETSETTESETPTVVRSPSSSSAGRTAQRAADRAADRAAKRATISVMPSALPTPIAISRAPMAKRDSGLGSPSGSVVSLSDKSSPSSLSTSPKSPKIQRTASYKRPSVSHMKQMIPLKTVEMNLPQAASVLPAPSGPPPQRPPPPVPVRTGAPSKKRPASQIAVASPFTPAPAVSDAMEIDEPVDQPMGMPSIIPMPAFAPAPVPAPAPVTTKTEKADKEKSWRLPKALTFRSRKKTASADTGAPSPLGGTSRPASFLPVSTAFGHAQPSPIGSIGHNSPSVPLPCAVGSNQPTRPNASWPPILASPLSHLSSGEHAPALNNTSAPTTTTTTSSSRPFSSSSFTFSLSSASTAVPATPSASSRPSSRRSNRPASRLSTHFSSLSLSPKQRDQQQQQQHIQHIQKDYSPPSSSFFFRVLSMSDPRKNGKAKVEVDSKNDSPLINTAIPTESLIEDDLFESLTFSKRGSLMFGGQRAADVASAMSSMGKMDKTQSTRVERESFQVRSLYMDARGLNWEDGRPPSIAVETTASSASPSAVSTNSTNNANPTITTTTATATTNPPSTLDLSSLSIADADPNRLSIVSATSIATASTGIALSGTESSLSLVTPQPTTNPVSPVSPRQPVTPSAAATTAAAASTPSTTPTKEVYELAGGIEDWEDVDVADVDRYGFIRAKPRPLTSASSVSSLATVGGDEDGNAPTRASTGLSSGLGRHFSRRHPSRKNTRNSARSMYTSRSTSTTATAAAAARSSLRAAANQLPHNKDRKWIDEAGDMLTMEPGLGDIAEDEDAERLAELVKRKEWERAEKWRRMAKVIARGTANGDGSSSSTLVPDGSGMDFEFDLRHPKLVERTWKGIPDRWRAPAWYSFLASSAAHRRAQRLPPVPPLPSLKDTEVESEPKQPKPDGGETEEQIIAAFYRLQETASPDDVQIDLDVPRTVNGHVMFRKRYRGGQRLLFRVLHALSLYFADTGYVQGMAALAATLLCYYDEERCFVMLVRLFHLRGLERLYEPGFGGLMEALGEFEQKWLARNSPRIAQKLSLLNIDPTTYATRWYLTLFNLSVPFAAQLRIWDVFMLLGDGDMEVGPLAASSSSSPSILKRPSTSGPTTARPATARPATADPKAAKSKSAKDTEHLSATALITASAPKPLASKANLAILHATSTALIDGLQEVLQDADFENAMKAVTSWVPIKDENLLMKVVHAEWKRHQRMK